MTLDEAISHAKEKAAELKQQYEYYDHWDNEEEIRAEECLECATEHEQLAEWLTELAERREEDRWISVKERVPEDYTKVLITNEYGVVNCVDWNTWYQNDYKNARKTYKAIAWRPLPEAYKEREETNE